MASFHCTVDGCRETNPTRTGTFVDLNNLDFRNDKENMKELIKSLLTLYAPGPEVDTDPSHILPEDEDYIEDIEAEELSEDVFQDFASSVSLFSKGTCVYMKLTPKNEIKSEFLTSLPLLRNHEVDGMDILVPLSEHCPTSFPRHERDVVVEDHELADEESIIQKSNQLLQRIKDDYDYHIEVNEIYEADERKQQETQSWLPTWLRSKTLFPQTRESEQTSSARPSRSPKRR